MKFTRLHLAALSLGLAIVGTMALPNQADAQRGQGGGQGRQGGGGFGGGRGGFGGGGFGGFGQGRGGFGGGMFGNNDPTRSVTTTLIQREDVQGELGVSAAQREKIQAAQQGMRQAGQRVMQESGIDFQAMRDPNLDPQKRQELMAQMREKMGQMREKMQAAQKESEDNAKKEIDASLTPTQRKRLAELELQYRGPLALADDTVAKQFNVTPEQQREIGNVLTEYRNGQQKVGEEMRSKMPQPGGGGQGFNREEMQKVFEDMQKSQERVKKASEDKVVALLNASQKSAWTAAKGKAFTFKSQEFGFGGRGQGRGQGRGGAPTPPPF